MIYFGDVSLLVSLDESPLTSSWNASTFTGGTRMPYEFLQHSADQGTEAVDGGIKPAKNWGYLHRLRRLFELLR